MIKKLFYLSNFTFLVLYLILAWHNRLSDDDFCSIINLHRHGIFKGTAVLYNTYCTRWLSVLVVNIVLSLMPYINALFLFNIVTSAAIIISVSYLLRNILHHFSEYRPGRILLLNLGIFSVNAFFYSCMDIGNIWFWLSAIPTYLWSFTFFIAGCGIIISGKKHQLFKTLVLSLSFFYIGGSAEAFAAIVLLAIVVAIIALCFSKPELPGKKNYLYRLYVGFFFCLSSLIILYLGHGNIVRQGLLGHISLGKALLLNIKTTGWIGIHWVSLIMPFALLFSLPLLYAGTLLSGNNLASKENASKIKTTLYKTVLLYGILVFIINYPITYLLCGIAPGRALISVSFLTWALFAFSFFYVGYKAAIKEVAAKEIAKITFSFCLILNTYNAIHQFAVTREYAMKYDTMMEDLTSKNHNSSVIVVSPLPSPGMLTPLHISQDPLSNNNIFLKNALGLKSYIMLVK